MQRGKSKLWANRNLKISKQGQSIKSSHPRLFLEIVNFNIRTENNYNFEERLFREGPEVFSNPLFNWDLIPDSFKQFVKEYFDNMHFNNDKKVKVQCKMF